MSFFDINKEEVYVDKTEFPDSVAYYFYHCEGGKCFGCVFIGLDNTVETINQEDIPVDKWENYNVNHCRGDMLQYILNRSLNKLIEDLDNYHTFRGKVEE